MSLDQSEYTTEKQRMSERGHGDSLLSRKNEYLQALHDITLGLLRRHDVQGLLQAIVIRAGKLMETDHCYVYLKNSSSTEMIMVFQSGIYDGLVHYPISPGQGLCGRVWQNAEPVWVDDYSKWEGRLPDPDRDIMHAMAGVPLTSNGEVVGVLGLAFVEPGRVFTAEMISQLAQFGELASLALENARLVEDSQRELAERKKAEALLRKLSVAVEQSPVSIVITDVHGTIEYANSHFTRLTGYSTEELIGQNPRVLKSGFTSAADYRKLWETILQGGEWRGEFYNIKKNGDHYWEMALIAPIRDENGTITHFVAIKEDITDQKKLESQLRHSQKMEAVGQMAGGIAHDFNNILTAIIGYSTIMQMKLPDESSLKVTVDQIIATAERGASLTQGLLAFSRKQVNNPVRIDLNAVIERVEKLLIRLIGEDVRLLTELQAEPLPIMADSMQIEQVIMNLATNARDAMPDGGTISISTETVQLDNQFVSAHGFGEKGRYALLVFSDTGCGMDEKAVKRIFEPFYTTKETGKGTGLGLSIVYGIIKKHGGYITCNSLIGMGTIFQIYLPLTDTEALPPVEAIPVEPTRGGSEVILLAEDDQATRSLAREVLENFGYTVIAAEDGTQALEQYRQHHGEICLVILDAVMPGMKGVDVYREISAITPDMPVIFCSGYGADAVEGHLPAGGRIHFIAKPFLPRELLAAIREVLEHGN